ncbi:MAG: aryl-sulfate sulfotransferase [Haloarculaceae archaeon]
MTDRSLDRLRPRDRLPPRRFVLRGIVGVALMASLLVGVATALSYERVRLGPGAVEDPANGTTVVSAQGFQFAGGATGKKPARLAGVGPNGSVEWSRLGEPGGAWFYDVDPLANGNLFVTSPWAGDTRLFEYDPETDTKVWQERIDATDTHDVDVLPDGNLLVANMRAWDESEDRSDDRLFVYDRETESVVWEWVFRDHYPNDTDEGMNEDWTHVNDVERVGEGEYLASPRNFDQVILVNRSTKAIEWRLGEDDDHDVLDEQHNPDYLQGPDGEATVLVADSENDRVVEYAREPDGSWTAVWSVTGFSWPRDADRLPNGNTLIVDTLHHRVVEVTPAGRIVWEAYVPWAPYDAERVVHGDESTGPTMRAVGASGRQVVHGGAGIGPAGSTSPADFLVRLGQGTPLAEAMDEFASTYAHVVPWIRPVWLAPWAFAYFAIAVVVAGTWGIAELLASGRLRRWLAGARQRVGRRARLDGISGRSERGPAGDTEVADSSESEGGDGVESEEGSPE